MSIRVICIIFLFFPLTHNGQSLIQSKDYKLKGTWLLSFTSNVNRAKISHKNGPVLLKTRFANGNSIFFGRKFPVNPFLYLQVAMEAGYQKYNWSFFASKQEFLTPYNYDHYDKHFLVFFSTPVQVRWENILERRGSNFFVSTGLELKWYWRQFFGQDVIIYHDTANIGSHIFNLDIEPNTKIKTFLVMKLDAGVSLMKINDHKLSLLVHFLYGTPPFNIAAKGTYKFFRNNQVFSQGEYIINPNLIGLGIEYQF